MQIAQIDLASLENLPAACHADEDLVESVIALGGCVTLPLVIEGSNRTIDHDLGPGRNYILIAGVKIVAAYIAAREQIDLPDRIRVFIVDPVEVPAAVRQFVL